MCCHSFEMWDTRPSAYNTYLQGFVSVGEFCGAMERVQSHWAYYTWWCQRIALEDPKKTNNVRNFSGQGYHLNFYKDKACEQRVKYIASALAQGEHRLDVCGYKWHDVPTDTAAV